MQCPNIQTVCRQAVAVAEADGEDSWFVCRVRAITVLDESVRHCRQFDTELHGRFDRSVQRLLPVRVRRMDPIASDTTRRITMGHVRSATSEESDRSEESSR